MIVKERLQAGEMRGPCFAGPDVDKRRALHKYFPEKSRNTGKNLP